jgi:hypothetical protein
VAGERLRDPPEYSAQAPAPGRSRRCRLASRDADERTRTSTELPPHGPEPNRVPVDASAGVQYVQIAAFCGLI